jgi:hypothetical protein
VVRLGRVRTCSRCDPQEPHTYTATPPICITGLTAFHGSVLVPLDLLSFLPKSV